MVQGALAAVSQISLGKRQSQNCPWRTDVNLKVSVIIPVHNVAEHLRACLDSLFRQTLTDIEIICVNDGSTDQSLVLFEEYAQSDQRLIIINQTWTGASPARNKGMDTARGEYLSFLDADDFFGGFDKGEKDPWKYAILLLWCFS